MFSFLKKPVSYEIVDYRRVSGTIVNAVRLKYRFIPFRPRIDLDQGHSFFNQMSVTSFNFWHKSEGEPKVVREVTEWFEKDFTKKKPVVRKFDVQSHKNGTQEAIAV